MGWVIKTPSCCYFDRLTLNADVASVLHKNDSRDHAFVISVNSNLSKLHIWRKLLLLDCCEQVRVGRLPFHLRELVIHRAELETSEDGIPHHSTKSEKLLRRI